MIIRGPQSNITKNLSEAEKQLGVDLKLNKDGDLELNNLNDFRLVAGGANAGQAARIKLQVEPGGLVYHPAIGANLQVGEKTKDAFQIKTSITKSLLQDPRFEDVDTKVQVNGNVAFVNIRITLASSGLQIPLQFVVV